MSHTANDHARPLTRSRPISMWWAGLAGGVTGILCVGPTVLALIGAMSAATA